LRNGESAVSDFFSDFARKWFDFLAGREYCSLRWANGWTKRWAKPLGDVLMFYKTLSFSEAGRRLRVSHKTVSEVVRQKQIPLRPHKPGGKAMGLDADGFRQLQEALRPIHVSA
jgi:hypothetical protein